MAEKNYGVLLTQFGAAELAPFLPLWARQNDSGSYFLAKEVDPTGPFVVLRLKDTLPNGEVVEMELQIRHEHVRAIIYGADIKRVGFVAP